MAVDTEKLKRAFRDAKCPGVVALIEDIEFDSACGKNVLYIGMTVDPYDVMRGRPPQTANEFLDLVAKIGHIKLGHPKGDFTPLEHLEGISHVLEHLNKEELRRFDAACGEVARISARHDPTAGRA